MTEKGVVTKVKGRRATVQFDRKSACDSCHMCAVTRDGMKVQIVIDNTLDARVGDVVTVQMGERFVLTAALIVYIIPLVLVGIGVGVGSLLGELAQILLAVAGLIVGFVIAFLLDRLVIRKKKGFSPLMVEIAPQSVIVTPAVLSEGSAKTEEVSAADANTHSESEQNKDNK